MPTSGKNKSQDRPPTKSSWSLLAHPLSIAGITGIFGLLTAIVIFQLQRPEPSTEELLTRIDDKPHRYHFELGGRTISGESYAPFEKGDGYYARVEACEKYGVEGILSIASCYMTIKPSQNLTISNSENVTEAIYDDGAPARICCMIMEGKYHAPIYRIRLPSGVIERRTIERGTEAHIMLNIPDIDPNHELDAIKFSPGEGVAPILFPIKGRITNRVLATSFINAHRDDPRIQGLVEGAIRMKADLEKQAEVNRGLTYQETN